MLTVSSEPLSVTAAVLFQIGDFPITNTMFMAIFDAFVFIFLCIIARSFSVTNPGRIQLMIESILGIITSLIEQVVGDKKVAWKIMPLVATLVLFILVSNLITTLLPILSGFTFKTSDGSEIALFRSHTNDFNTTLALAFSMVLLTQIFSMFSVNPIGYIGRFIKIGPVIRGFRQGIGAGLMSLVELFLGVLDIVSEFAKIVSLSLRLFGNMFAGELLIGVLMTILAVGLPIPIIGLATLSGIIQSIVFGSLVASFFAGVLKTE